MDGKDHFIVGFMNGRTNAKIEQAAAHQQHNLERANAISEHSNALARETLKELQAARARDEAREERERSAEFRERFKAWVETPVGQKTARFRSRSLPAISMLAARDTRWNAAWEDAFATAVRPPKGEPLPDVQTSSGRAQAVGKALPVVVGGLALLHGVRVLGSDDGVVQRFFAFILAVVLGILFSILAWRLGVAIMRRADRNLASVNEEQQRRWASRRDETYAAYVADIDREFGFNISGTTMTAVVPWNSGDTSSPILIDWINHVRDMPFETIQDGHVDLVDDRTRARLDSPVVPANVQILLDAMRIEDVNA
ncbi:MAG: hypothetical protein H7201_04620 [Candidatus Saccharibacteria bacterium]|nr:hypothetical protein [Microbacteriaceae bacterium]